MSDHNKDPLDSLFVNEILDKQLLVEIIQPYIQLHISGEIIYKAEWDNLNLQKKILLYLLSRKALHEKGIQRDNGIVQEEATAKEIEDDTDIKGNSLRPTLSSLQNNRMVSRKEDGGSVLYYVQNHKLKAISQYIGT